MQLPLENSAKKVLYLRLDRGIRENKTPFFRYLAEPCKNASRNNKKTPLKYRDDCIAVPPWLSPPPPSDSEDRHDTV